jgi:lipopolysaccharide export system permease protein
VKTLSKYIVRQMLATLLMTVAVFTFVLLVTNVLKDVLQLLVNGQVSLGLFAETVGLLIPWVWAFALPMGMLTSALLVFGRFSADHELTAVRASGISLVSLVSPVLVLSLVMCALTAVVNLEVAPLCRVAYKDLRLKFKVELAGMQLPEGRYIKDFEDKGYIFYIGKNRGGMLEDVNVLFLATSNNPTPWTVYAPRGQYWKTNQQLHLKLSDAISVIGSGENALPGGLAGDVELTPIDLEARAKSGGKPDISNMTFWQLRDELQDVAGRFGQLPEGKLTPDQLRQTKEQLRKMKDDFTSPIRVQIHKQLATSFACFGFTLLGIPLGIRMHRRETNVGFFVALLLVAVYYGLLLIGLGLEARPEFVPHLIVWVPNFIFQAVGAVLLWRANRGL